MATLQLSTASNAPTIDPTQVDPPVCAPLKWWRVQHEMATLQLSTASNAPTIDPTQVDELR